MDHKIFMRWSDGVGFAVPFCANGSQDIIDGLTEFRRSSGKNAHLHVFVPYGSRGHWCDPIQSEHIVAPGGDDNVAVRPHAETVLKSGLISEAIIGFSETDCARFLDEAKKTFRLWATTGTDRDYTAYAMRDSLAVLREDLIANIRQASDDDLIPSPADENNPAVLQNLASRYGLKRDFDRAYPVA